MLAGIAEDEDADKKLEEYDAGKEERSPYKKTLVDEILSDWQLKVPEESKPNGVSPKSLGTPLLVKWRKKRRKYHVEDVVFNDTAFLILLFFVVRWAHLLWVRRQNGSSNGSIKNLRSEAAQELWDQLHK